MLGTLYLDAPYIDQYAQGAPEGCEAASLLMALWYKGILTGTSYHLFIPSHDALCDGWEPLPWFCGNTLCQ